MDRLKQLRDRLLVGEVMFHPEAEGWKEIPVKAFFRRIGPLNARRNGEAWEYGLLTTAEHNNSAGVVHGGVLAAFADQALSTIAWAAAERRAASTVSLDIHFARAVTPGQFVVAQGRVVRAGASLVLLTGVLACEGRDIAVVSGTWSISKA